MIETEKIKKDQINDNCLHMRFDSHNHVTTRRNGQQSVQFEIMIFSKTRRLRFVAKAIFVLNFLQSEKKTRKRFQKKSKIDEWMTFVHQITEIQKVSSWRD